MYYRYLCLLSSWQLQHCDRSCTVYFLLPIYVGVLANWHYWSLLCLCAHYIYAHHSYSSFYTKPVFDNKSFLEAVSNADWFAVLDTNDPQVAFSWFWSYHIINPALIPYFSSVAFWNTVIFGTIMCTPYVAHIHYYTFSVLSFILVRFRLFAL